MTRLWPFAVLLVMGAGWGLTQPLGKIAVSTGYGAFGLIFWQLAISTVVLGGVVWARGQYLPMTRAHLRLYVMIALLGTVLPNAASFEAIRHLPSGIVSILLSLVPIFALPIALFWRLERFDPIRSLGLLLGAIAVIMIAAPQSSLPSAAMVAFLPLGMIAPLFYGIEGNYVARYGTLDIGPIRTLFGAALVGTPMALGLALVTGQFIDPRPPWGAPDAALVGSSVVHVAVYTLYVWLVGRAGPVFAAQVSYVVTLTGLGWAMWILDERYSPWIWAAVVVMMVGVFLVQPRRTRPLAEIPKADQTPPG